MASPLLRFPGAVAAAEPDTGVAAHYGEPMAEQRAMTRTAGLVDRSNRGVVRIAGADRLSWLHSLTTQDFEHLTPHTAAEALVLSPNGHVEHHLTVTDDGTAVWAHVEPGMAAGLVSFLESMRFMLQVQPEDLTGQFAVLTLAGPQAADLPPSGMLSLPTALGIDLLVPSERLADTVAALTAADARPAGMWAFEALRIAAHQPRLGLDTDHRTIPHEVGWIGSAVKLDKGCYRGQETVARVHNLGHPPRRLVMLHLDGSVDRLPAHGDQVELDGAAVGFVGSAERHHELGPVALALVKRTIPVDAQLLASGVAATQEVIVPPDAGANVKADLRPQSFLRRA